MMTTLAQYWELSTQEREPFQERAGAMTIHGLPEAVSWQIYGTLRIPVLEYCDCEHCQGHACYKDVDVNDVVSARGPEDAADVLKEKTKELYCDDLDWDKEVGWMKGPTAAPAD